MSRSADRAGRHPYVVIALSVLLTGGALAGADRAAAAPAPPLAPVVAVVAPVLDLAAPVLDVSFGESDLKGEERVEQLPDRTTITLDSTVLFAKDSATLSARARARVSDVGRQLQTRGPGSVRVTGYTDDLGSASYGKDLSRRRARAVTEVLRDRLSTADYAFTVVGRGEDDPAAPNTSEANRRVNRRVVVLYQRR